ncbi:ROK family protein [Clostridium sp.]|uniref:ROK family protein n=1 Tax=Clostridium sp. TaxID=1506 RepID=UPI003D6D74D2
MRILCFDIGGTAIKIGLVDENGNILENREIPTDAGAGGEKLISKILDEISVYKDIDRVGISTAGQVDFQSGKVIFASENLPGWTGMEIKKRIEDKYSILTAVENDVNAAAIGEAYYGLGEVNLNFLCLTYGTGIGGAIVENGKIYRGATGSAGEFGHMITHVGGLKCSCGGRGCYEAYASTSALVRSVKASTNTCDEIDGKYIFKRVLEENEEYKQLVDRWIVEVAMGLCSIIHMYNPSHIILGGGIMQQEYILARLRVKISEYVMPNFNKVQISLAKLGNTAGLLGVSILAKELE